MLRSNLGKGKSDRLTNSDYSSYYIQCCQSQSNPAKNSLVTASKGRAKRRGGRVILCIFQTLLFAVLVGTRQINFMRQILRTVRTFCWNAWTKYTQALKSFLSFLFLLDNTTEQRNIYIYILVCMSVHLKKCWKAGWLFSHARVKSFQTLLRFF